MQGTGPRLDSRLGIQRECTWVGFKLKSFGGVLSAAPGLPWKILVDGAVAMGMERA